MIELKHLTLEDYPLKTYDKTRYADTDRQGHINNAVFSIFLETGRVELLFNPNKPCYRPGGSFVIANLNVSLLAEIQWPGTVEIGTAITKLGNSSIQLAQGLYQNGKIVATAETVIVQVDNESKHASSLTQETKELLSQYMFKTEMK
jgi:acyl-CoA thioester hydrolase